MVRADVCGDARLDLRTLKPDAARAELRLPWVQTRPAAVGRRINRALYKVILNTAPPADGSAAKVQSWWAAMNADHAQAKLDASEELSFQTLRHDPRLLILLVRRSGCATRCWSSDEQLMFDLRTGERVSPDELFSAAGRVAIVRRFRAALQPQIRAERQRQMAAGGVSEADAALACLQEWRERRRNLHGLAWQMPGHWSLAGPSCRGISDESPALVVTWPEAVLKPYLNAYGRSLLLGHRDVRSAEPLTLNCPAPRSVPDPEGWAARVAEISAGEDHTFLREVSGRVWGWGRNYNGAVGNGEPGDGRGKWTPPFVMGEGFLKAGAGHGFSAVIGEDGTLWTWGSNYAAKLGDGSQQNQIRPVRIGEGMVDLVVGNGLSLALARDGRLLAWGGEPIPGMRPDGNNGYRLVPRVVAQGVAQIRDQGAALLLKENGDLWNWSGWWRELPGGGSVVDPQALIWRGSGYARLPAARNLGLAFRADGSAWAWGETLNAMRWPAPSTATGLSIGEDGEETPWPRLVGHGWVALKALNHHRSPLVVGLKADGSLWVGQSGEMRVRMVPISCGYSDLALAYDHRGIHLFALDNAGVLKAWGPPLGLEAAAAHEWQPMRDLLASAPRTVLQGVVRLFQENDYHGNVGARVFALLKDGTLRRWYWDFGHDDDEKARHVELWFEPIEFPTEWFKRSR